MTLKIKFVASLIFLAVIAVAGVIAVTTRDEVNVNAQTPSAITAKIQASRATASSATDVAPLAVFFDAKTTTWTGKTATEVWLDLEFKWDFGDPNAGTWQYGNQDRKSVV